MANTIIKTDILQKELIRQLDKNRVITAWANRKYEGDLKQQGDTVRVQEFPRLRGQRGGTAGEDITVQDWTVTSHTLTVAQLNKDNRKVKDIERVQSNLSLTTDISTQLQYAINQAFENHVAKTIMDGVHADNKISEGSPVAVSKSNVYETIDAMRVALSKKNAYNDAALFADPKTCGYLRQSSLFDGYVEGLQFRKNVPTMSGLAGTFSGFTVYETNNLPYKRKLTLDTVPTANDTVTITVFNVETDANVSIVFKFVASPSAAGDVDIGIDAATSAANLKAAIEGGAGAGTAYVDVSATNRGLLREYEVSLDTFVANVSYLKANRNITTALSMTAGTNVFGTAALVLLATDKEAVNFVDQLTKFKVVDGSVNNNGFYDNLLYESSFQAAVLGRNKNRIATTDITIQ